VRVGRQRLGTVQGEQRDSLRAEQFGTGRDDHIAADAVGKRLPNSAVQRNATLEEHLLPHRARTLDPSKVVAGDRIHQSRDDIVARATLLESDADVGVDERRTGRFEVHRGFGGLRNASDVTDADAQIALGAFLEK